MNAIAVEHTIPIRRTLHQAVAAEPDRVEFNATSTKRLEYALAVDPDQLTHMSEVFTTPADELGIHLDGAYLPDELLPDDPNPPPFDDNDLF